MSPEGGSLRNEFQRRLLIPFAVTLGAATVIVVVVFNLSRVLLALEAEAGSTAATAVAIAGASAVLVVGAWFASRRRPGSRPGLAVLISSGLMLVLAGSVSYATLQGGGEEGTELAHGGGGGGEPPPPVTITAFDLGFRESEATAAAGEVDIRYRNEGELAHTLVVEGAPGAFKLEVPAGGTSPGKVKLDPGSYQYYCDLPGHRAAGMEGTLTVTEGKGGAPASGGGGGSSTEVVAQDIAFAPTEITVPAGPVELALKNEGAILHSLVIDGVPGFRKLEAAAGATVTGTLDAGPGTYTYYCDQPGHRAAGMEGKLAIG
jgi:plastocyanin